MRGTCLKHDDFSLPDFFMPLVKPIVKIENVVACAALKQGIDFSSG